MVHVDCRATSDSTAQVSLLARISHPPTFGFRQSSADRTVFTSKDGLDAFTWLANKKKNAFIDKKLQNHCKQAEVQIPSSRTNNQGFFVTLRTGTAYRNLFSKSIKNVECRPILLIR